jgi:hypothetical protein
VSDYEKLVLSMKPGFYWTGRVDKATGKVVVYIDGKRVDW